MISKDIQRVELSEVDKDTLMLFHSIIRSRLNFKKKEEFTVPQVVHSELKPPCAMPGGQFKSKCALCAKYNQCG